MPTPASAWTDYFELQVDEDPPVFRVSLTADQTRILRSSYHAGPCLLCRGRRARRGVSADAFTGAFDAPVSRGRTDAPSDELTEGTGRGSV